MVDMTQLLKTFLDHQTNPPLEETPKNQGDHSLHEASLIAALFLSPIFSLLESNRRKEGETYAMAQMKEGSEERRETL